MRASDRSSITRFPVSKRNFLRVVVLVKNVETKPTIHHSIAIPSNIKPPSIELKYYSEITYFLAIIENYR